MSPVSPDEAELEGVLDSIGLGLSAQACEAYPVVDALSAVFVTDVKHDGFFSEVKQKPAIRTRSAPGKFASHGRCTY